MERTRYQIAFRDEEAKEQFKSLPKNMKKVIGEAMHERLGSDPLAYGKPLRHNLRGYRRMRVGRYRVIYKVDEVQMLVIVALVDHRKDVYGFSP